jgi:hypothetical protein
VKNGFLLLILVTIILQLMGCSKGGGVEVVYAPTVRWYDTNYTITSNTLMAKEDIGEQINTIKKVVKKFPKENCEANSPIEVGTKLYRIKNENITEAVAVEYNGKYLKAVITELIQK